ncbi:MAG: hypothetical protein ABIP20_18740 [Chthoniobacteraceae bacterium]
MAFFLFILLLLLLVFQNGAFNESMSKSGTKSRSAPAPGTRQDGMHL